MNDMSLKAKINNIAKEKNVFAQEVLHNYLFYHFLMRLEKSDYKDKFVIKGGTLIASMIGISSRTTMDLDATIKDLPLTKEALIKAFNEITSIDVDDNMSFKYDRMEPIRENDEYGGFRLIYYTKFGRLNEYMSIDISTGDVITPGAKLHTFIDLLDSNNSIQLWSYPIETVLAEKLEAILSLGTKNTRPRDFYDVYKLSVLRINNKNLKKAFLATTDHRKNNYILSEHDLILNEVENSKFIKEQWEIFTREASYEIKISFDQALSAVRGLLSIIFD